jgi:hypothetical protein
MSADFGGNVVTLTGLTLAAETSALLDHAPDIQGDPNLIALLGLKNIRPCTGHWHADTDAGKVTFGPAIGGERTLALYAGESEHVAVQRIVENTRNAGAQLKFDYIANWKRLLAGQEFNRLSDPQKVVVLSLQELSDPRVMFGILLSGVEIADVRRAIIAGNGDSAATMAELEKLSPANSGSGDEPDHGVIVIDL